jgi:serine/threonine protein phosphatase PrpC
LAATIEAITHAGHRRKNNEDRVSVNDHIFSESLVRPKLFYYFPCDRLTCIVADGMGGHAAGETASRIVIDAILGEVGQVRSSADVSDMIERANQTVYSAMNHELAGMGSTIAGIVLSHGRIIYFNVGDSRVYRFEDSQLEQLSVDDVLEPREGLLRKSSSVTQALGGYFSRRRIRPHVGSHTFSGPVQFLICSDGLTDLVDDAEIAQALGTGGPGSTEHLLSMALTRGGLDNISIILVQLSCRDAAAEGHEFPVSAASRKAIRT